MTRATATAYNKEGSYYDASSFMQTSRLLILLSASVLLHAAVIGLWPAADSGAFTAMPTARLAVQLQRESALPAAKTDTVAAATAVEKTQASRPANSPKPTPRKRSAAQHTATAATAGTTAQQPQNAPTSAAAHTATHINTAELHTRVNSTLQQALIAHFDYPSIARRRGWEGVVQVSVRVEANGQLSQVRLIATSGYALLDRAAMKSLGDIQRLKDAADWLNGQQLDMIFPIRYQLIDS